MKSKVLLILFLSLLGKVVSAQLEIQSNLPDEVHQDFSRRFPVAYNINWDIRQQNNRIEAIFNYNGRKYYTRYDSLGKVIQTQKEIRFTELPTLIVKSLHKDYLDFTIDELYCIKLRDKIIYEVVVKGADKAYILNYYPYGVIYKKQELSITHLMTENSAI